LLDSSGTLVEIFNQRSLYTSVVEEFRYIANSIHSEVAHFAQAVACSYFYFEDLSLSSLQRQYRCYTIRNKAGVEKHVGFLFPGWEGPQLPLQLETRIMVEFGTVVDLVMRVWEDTMLLVEEEPRLRGPG
jgi:hypothetical protein